MDMLTKLLYLMKFVFLGLVQGITEPLPISSSGHLVLIRELFGIEITNLSFEIIVHFGSLIAIVVVYREDIIQLTKGGFAYLTTKQDKYRHDFLFFTYLIVATGVTGAIGLLFEDIISNHLTQPIYIGGSLLITSFLLWIIRNLKGQRTDRQITIKDAVIIGFAQSIALVPGISRSGMTVIAAMLLGMRRTTALRFSFLLFIPVSLGITALSFKDIVNELTENTHIIPYLLAFLVAIFATYYALRWFINIMKTGRLHLFSLYCLIVGLFVIVFM